MCTLHHAALRGTGSLHYIYCVATKIAFTHHSPSCCRFVVEHTIEENVAAVCRQRAAAMDMSAAVPVRRGSSCGGGGSSIGGDAADLTVRDVAALLSTKWWEGCEGEEGGQQPLDMTLDH